MPSSNNTSPARPSKFVEGSAVTGPELLQRTNTTQEHFNTVLAMEDAMTAQRKGHRSSHSSSSSSSAATGELSHGGKNFNFPRFSLDERPRAMVMLEEDADRVVEKVKGRFRSLTTSGKRRDVQPYPGT